MQAGSIRSLYSVMGHVGGWPYVGPLPWYMYCHVFKSLRLVWRCGTNRWNLWVFDLPISCSNTILNSLASGKNEWNFKALIFQIISVIDGWSISCHLALRWMSLDLTTDKSTLNRVMAWCFQATSHYLSRCWPRSLSPYGVTGPQWVKS